MADEKNQERIIIQEKKAKNNILKIMRQEEDKTTRKSKAAKGKSKYPKNAVLGKLRENTFKKEGD